MEKVDIDINEVLDEIMFDLKKRIPSLFRNKEDVITAQVVLRKHVNKIRQTFIKPFISK